MWLVASALVIFLALASLLLGMPAIYGWGVYKRFRGKRTVVCPETNAGATVRPDAVDAASGALHGHPRLRLAACSRWPEKRNCGQECVVQIFREPLDDQRGFNIFPVLLGAVVTWGFLGTLAYTATLRNWIVRLGVPERVVQQGYELVFPALVPLVVAIGLGFLVQRALQRSKRSAAVGALVGAAVGLAMSLVALPLAHQAGPILWAYLAFAVLASAMMGAFLTIWKSVVGSH